MEKILLYPDKRLRQKAEPIEEVTQEIVDRAMCMFDLLYRSGGIGLAAPQIGWCVRLFVVNTTGDIKDELVLINPEIINQSKEQWSFTEGCLSLPGVAGKVKRSRGIVIKAQNLKGEEHEIVADGLVARAILHELDHLDGILFLDKLSAARKVAITKKLKILRAIAAQ